LQQAGLSDAAGKLTQAATDAVVVRDDCVIRTRDALPRHLSEVLGMAYRTSGESVREAESLREFEPGHNLDQQRLLEEAAEQLEWNQKALRVRNIDDDLTQAEQAIEHTHEAKAASEAAREAAHEAREEHQLEIETNVFQRSDHPRTRSQSLDVGMGL
jgi:hypothetical protein